MAAVAIIFLILAAILMTPLGIFAKYNADEGFMLSASAWYRFKIGIFPRQKKVGEKEGKKTDESAAAERKKFSLGFTKNDWTQLIKAALKAVKRIAKGICFDEIFVRCTVSDGDPFDAVTRYNAINGAVGAALPFIENEFKVSKKDIVIDLDLENSVGTLNCRVKASVRLGRLLLIAIVAGVGFLKLLVKNRIRCVRERKARNGKQQTQRNDAVNDEQYQESCGSQ